MTKLFEPFEKFLKELREIEKKWQNEWYSKGIFNAEPDYSKKKFFITVPYPYVSGPLHIGHGRTFTIADVIARFKRMIGFNVLFPIAWHITGTPIQAVADRIARGDQDALDLYKWYVSLYISNEKKVNEIVSSFSNGWNIVKFFSSVVENDFKSIGLSIDFTRQFTTGDPDYMAFIIWQFSKLKDLGLITRGKHAIPFAPAENQAVGEHDIKGGDEITISILDFTLVKFKLEDEENTYVVAATLRPETIFGVTNIWINPDADYVIIDFGNEKWIISEKAAWKLNYQEKKFKIVKKLKGFELIGKFVIAPVINRKVPILPAFFVDDDTATGVVYSVPAHAPYDYVALKDLKSNSEILKKYNIEHIVKDIEPIDIIETPGYGKYPAIEIVEKFGVKNQFDREKLDEATKTLYKDEFYNGVMKENTTLPGVKVSEAREKIREILINSGFGDRMFEIEPRKVYTRAGNRVIIAIIPDQWFINYANPDWKSKTLRLLNSMKIVPEKYRKIFESTIEWLAQRPCARKRGIGTKLPWDTDWIIESLSDSTIYMAFYTIVNKLRNSGISEKLSKLIEEVYSSKPEVSEKALSIINTFFDYIFYGKGDVKEISNMLNIPIEVIEGIRKEFEYWYPVDQRHSGIDLITNHLTFFLFHHTAIFPEKYWPRSITLNEYVIREGMKMSRSLGNVLPLVEVPRRYSADVFRLYITYAADLESVLDWRDEEVSKIIGRLERFWNLVNTIIKEYRPIRELKYEEISIISKWLISKVNKLIQEIPKMIDNLNLRSYVVESFFNMLSNVEFYLDVAKLINLSIDEISYTLWYVLERWVKILQPVIPHICEEIWHRMGKSTYVSLESWPVPEIEYIKPEFDYALNIVFRTIDDIKNILRAREKKAKKIYIYVGPEEIMYRIANEASKMLNEGKSMGDVIKTLIKLPEFKQYSSKIPDIVRKIINGFIPRELPSREIEIEFMKVLSKYIAVKVNAEEVIVEDATKPTYDPMNKAKTALPGRPAIYIIEE